MDKSSWNSDLTSVMPTKVQTACWIGLVIVLLFIALINSQAYLLGTHFDDARYVILARSLLSSDHYGMIDSPGDPPTGKYPFLYPLVLTPFLFLFPQNLDALKIPSLLATLANVTLLFFGWRWFSKTLSHWWSLAVAAMSGLSPLTIGLTHRVMSEPLFTTFVLISIMLAEQAARKQERRWWALAVSIALIGLFYTRSIGILLIGCMFLYLIYKRGLGFARQLGLVLAFMVLIVAGVLFTERIQPRDLLPLEYLKDDNAGLLVAPVNGVVPANLETPPPTDWLQNAKTLVIDYILVYGVEQHLGKDLRSVALAIGGGLREQALADRIGISFLPELLGYAISAIVLYGWYRFFKREGLSLFLIFGMAYLAALFLWVWDDPRLLYPIQAQIELGFLLGVQCLMLFIAERFSARSPQPVFTCLVVLLVVAAVFKGTQTEDSRIHTGDLRERTSWLEENSSPSDVIMSEAPEIDYLYSQRKTVTFPVVHDSKQLQDVLAQEKVNYVLIAPYVQWQEQYTPEYSEKASQFRTWLDDLTAQNQAQLVYCYKPDLIRVYKIKR